MSKFNFIKTDIPDVQIIEPTVFGDDRGYFMETYQIDEFAAAGIDKPFVQDNQSRSTKGVLRGLHFQTKHTQGKLVRVTLGEVFDVAVDCRPNSKTFGKWVGATLSADNKKMLWIPEGFRPRLCRAVRCGRVLLQVHRRLRPHRRGRHSLR